MPLSKKDGEKLVANIAREIEEQKWLAHDVDKLEKEGKLTKKAADEIRKKQEHARRNIDKIDDEITKTIVARFPSKFGKPRAEKKEVEVKPKEVVVPKEEPAIIEVPRTILERINSGIEAQAAYFRSYEEIAKKQLEAFDKIKEVTEEEKAIREDYSEIVYPPSGGTVRIPVGTTILDLWTGDAYLGDGAEGKLSDSLMSAGQLYARSIYIDTNKAFTVQLDGKTPHSIGDSGFFSRQGIQCRRVEVAVTEPALLKFVCSTNPDASFAEMRRPDWTSPINIAEQGIAQVIERPKYGAAQFADYSDTIAEGSYDALFSISGTGMIYGGVIKQLGSFGTFFIVIDIYIDGVELDYWDLLDLSTWQIEDKNMAPVWEQYYSEENDKYIQGITRGITFEESFKVYVHNCTGSGASDAVEAQLFYALI